MTTQHKEKEEEEKKRSTGNIMETSMSDAGF
jgi:hypothetical protein